MRKREGGIRASLEETKGARRWRGEEGGRWLAEEAGEGNVR